MANDENKDLVVREDDTPPGETGPISEAMGGYQALALFGIIAAVMLVVFAFPTPGNPAVQTETEPDLIAALEELQVEEEPDLVAALGDLDAGEATEEAVAEVTEEAVEEEATEVPAAEMSEEAIEEATEEPVAEVTEEAIEEEATEEPVAEVTEEAVEEEATEEPAAEVTEEAVEEEATEEPTAEVTEEAVEEATEEPTAEVTEEAVEEEATEMETADESPWPATVADAIAAGDVVNGEAVFLTPYDTAVGTWICSSCHSVDETQARQVGPALWGIYERAEERVLESGDANAVAYVYNSILIPEAYHVTAEPDYPVGLMPPNYGEVLTEQELADVVAYVLTLGNPDF